MPHCLGEPLAVDSKTGLHHSRNFVLVHAQPLVIFIVVPVESQRPIIHACVGQRMVLVDVGVNAHEWVWVAALPHTESFQRPVTGGLPEGHQATVESVGLDDVRAKALQGRQKGVISPTTLTGSDRGLV